MSEMAGDGLALMYHGADLDLAPFAELLASLQVAAIPLGEGDPEDAPAGTLVIYLLSLAGWLAFSPAERETWGRRLADGCHGLIVAGEAGDDPAEMFPTDPPPQWLELPIRPVALRLAIRHALAAIRLRLRLDDAHDQLAQRSHELREVHRVGVALSAERDMDALRQMVVRIAREMTRADAATLYLVEDGADGRKTLVFHVAQNDSVPMPSQRLAIALTPDSMAGFVALTGQVVRLEDVYHLPAQAPYIFNPALDQRFGYRSRSMLIVPMRNHLGAVIGVLQLINRKCRFSVALVDAATVAREVEPFSEENEQLVLSFASQAAVTIENQLLVENIEHLLAGFVRASVTAIESRDPATSGHSDRVARLTVGLAQAANEVGWGGMRFSHQQLKEIEYAGLLHDFGKVGVRESVLVKAKKLHDWQLTVIRNRFQYAMQLVENRALRRHLDIALAHGAETYRALAAPLDREHEAELAALQQALQLILAANEPTVLEEDNFQALRAVAGQTVLSPTGEPFPLLLDEELRSLLVRRGTLDAEEIREIQSHVNHSFNFLIQIPWTRDLQAVPGIAAAHHEKLDGTGYPRQLRGNEIPVQARMMTIADIFDALAAQDRPYKPPVPVPRALEILREEARRGAIDGDLLDLFVAREVYRVRE